MLPRPAGDEETREGGEMGLEDLLGLGLLPPTMGHGGGSSAQQRPYEKTGFEEPLRFAAASETTSLTLTTVRPRPRQPVDVDDGGVVLPAPPSSMPPKQQPAWAPAPAGQASSPKVCVPVRADPSLSRNLRPI